MILLSSSVVKSKATGLGLTLFGSDRSSRNHNLLSVCPVQVCLHVSIFIFLGLSFGSDLSQVSLKSLSLLHGTVRAWNTSCCMHFPFPYPCTLKQKVWNNCQECWNFASQHSSSETICCCLDDKVKVLSEDQHYLNLNRALNRNWRIFQSGAKHL